ncbi:hypothetical protein [Candidatus Skiveiella danica]|uniref:hypothetical protein n=1 Tax=Candidatus Skiveiella danica TaxID=3386177 RepID=UPI0039B8E3A1
MKRRLFSTTAIVLAFSATGSFAQTKWDLPAAYPATNFHTENITQFAKDVDAATGGKLKITVHANASLFKAPEIKRAVQGGQAQIGEILLVNFENESPIYGAGRRALPGHRAMPMHASCMRPRSRPGQSPDCAGHEVAVLGALAAPGHLQQEAKSPRWRTCVASSGAPTAPPRPRWPN